MDSCHFLNPLKIPFFCVVTKSLIPSPLGSDAIYGYLKEIILFFRSVILSVYDPNVKFEKVAQPRKLTSTLSPFNSGIAAREKVFERKQARKENVFPIISVNERKYSRLSFFWGMIQFIQNCGIAMISRLADYKGL